MTVEIGSQTITHTELGMLMAASVDLGLVTDELGNVFLGVQADVVLLRQELEAILQAGQDQERVVAAKALQGLKEDEQA